MCFSTTLLLSAVVCGVAFAWETIAAESFPPLEGREPPENLAELWEGYDPTAEPLEVEVVREWRADGIVTQMLVYTVGTFRGEPARIAAYYARPAEVESPVPGILQIHGGGQRAERPTVEAYAKNGYASLSINWGGRELDDAEPGDAGTDWGAVDATQTGHNTHYSSIEPDDKTLDAVASPRNSNWFLITVAARRGLTLLTTQPEVDADRLGVTGHSMGGRLTVMTAGVDPRVKAAVPSCGGVAAAQEPLLGRAGAAIRRRPDLAPLYLAAIDELPSLRRITCPILYLGPHNDFHGMLDQLYANWREVPSDSIHFSISPHFNHRHLPESAFAGPRFFDCVLRDGGWFPETPRLAVDLETEHAVPLAVVEPERPDDVTAVDVFYSSDPHGITRFWQRGKATRQGARWVARCEVSTTDQPLFVMANVRYPQPQPMVGPPWEPVSPETFLVSSWGVTVEADALQAAGVGPTQQPQEMIQESFSDLADWYQLNPDNPWHRQWVTRKVKDPLWRGRPGARLAVDVLDQQGGELVLTCEFNTWAAFGKTPPGSWYAVMPFEASSDWQTVEVGIEDLRLLSGHDERPVDWSSLTELGMTATVRSPENRDEILAGGRWPDDRQVRRLRWQGGEPPPVTVMSFNIRYGTANDGENAWPHRRERVIDCIRAANPDLLGTQETLAFQRDELAAGLPGYAWVGVGRDDGGEAGEMAALCYREARFEQVDAGHFWLSPTPEMVGSQGWDAALPRIASWVRLRDRQSLTGHEILYLNTHFDHRGTEARVESARLIRKWLSDQAAECRVIVTGDFNAAEGSEPYNALFGATADNDAGLLPLVDALREVKPVATADEGTFTGFDAEQIHGARIDWIGCSPDWRILSAVVDRTSHDGRTPSDHAAVIAVVAAPAEIPRPHDAPRPLSPDDARRTFKLPEGLRVQLVAAEPLICEPSGVCWDAAGRLFVSELHGYNLEGQEDIEQLNKTGVLDREVRRIQAPDDAKQRAAADTFGTIKLLHDDNGDGRMDRATLFADQLPPCYGIVPARDGVIAVAAPSIFFLADRDGDGVADVRQRLYDGFAAGILERNINQPQQWSDGWIYVGAGAGGGRITGPRLAEAVDLPNTDFRFKPDGTAIEPVVGRTHTFGFTCTDRGERIVISTSSPGILVAPLSWEATARNPDHPLGRLEQRLGESQTFPASKPHPWRSRREADPGFSAYYRDRYGIAESAANGYFTSACSPFFYDDTALPEITGQLLTCEPAQNLIHRSLLKRDHGGLELERPAAEMASEFFTSSDVWFHGMNLAHAPDGGVAIVDFYREIIEDYSAIPRYLQQQYELDHGIDRGRIWKIVADSMPPTEPAMDVLSERDLVSELASPRFWRRQTAFRLLAEGGGGQQAADIARLVDDGTSRAGVVSALRLLAYLEVDDTRAVQRALSHPDPAVRTHAVQVAAASVAQNSDLRVAVMALADDPDVGVVRQVAVAMGNTSDPRAVALLAKIARTHGSVLWMDAAVMTAAADRAGELLEALLNEPEAIGEADSLVPLLARAVAVRRDPAELSASILAITSTADESLKAAGLAGVREAFAETTSVTITPAAVRAITAAAADGTDEVATSAGELVRLMRIESAEQREARLAEARARLSDPQASPEIRLAAVHELAEEGDAAIASHLIGAFTSATPAVREAILTACFARSDRLPVVVAAMESGELPAAACSALQRSTLATCRDREVAQRAEKLFASLTAPAVDRLGTYLDACRTPRDVSRGHQLFLKHCGVCHRSHGEGVAVGPDLDGESQQPYETLLLSILAPNARIAGGYTTYRVLTTDGRVVSGLLAADTATSVTLLGQEGKSETILRREIDELVASPISLMPESLATALAPGDVADILAWLRQ